MYPKLFGFLDTYAVCMVIGIVSAFVVYLLYLKKIKVDFTTKMDLTLCLVIAVGFGIIFAILFQNLYDLVKDPSHYHWEWSMTFIGGLAGGVGGFFLMYFLYFMKRHPNIMGKLIVIAPGCISIAHAIGRIGCLMDGCCYGKPTDEWYGIYFETLGYKAIPTQLFEAIFLFVLSAILIFLAFKFDFFYTMPIYLFSYSIWRFLIEFIRDDDRGAFIGVFSPSQFWCFFIFAGSIILFYIFLKIKKAEETSTNVQENNGPSN